jgi:DNA-binding transcriptional regulator YdaS (Cro superfamily)
MDDALQRALTAAGGTVALARAIGVSHQAVVRWSRVPPLRVLAVEKVTGISREILRPDIYPPTPGRKKAR